jgi:hypothetical protein
MGLISRAWTNLAPPGAISPPVDLTHASTMSLFVLSTMFLRMTYSGSSRRFGRAPGPSGFR